MRRNAAIEVLRKQAASRPVEVKPAPRTEDIERIDRSLRAAFSYLAEFAREVNAANPVVGHRYRMIYMGELPPLTLTDAFADYRMRKIGERDFYDFVTLSCRLRPTDEATAHLAAPDIPRFQQELDALQVERQRRDTRNDFGLVSHASFTLTAIPCHVRIRADYDAFTIVVELRNAGRLGRSRCSFAPGAFTGDVVDELAQYILGLDGSFASRLAVF